MAGSREEAAIVETAKETAEKQSEYFSWHDWRS